MKLYLLKTLTFFFFYHLHKAAYPLAFPKEGKAFMPLYCQRRSFRGSTYAIFFAVIFETSMDSVRSVPSEEMRVIERVESALTLNIQSMT